MLYFYLITVPPRKRDKTLNIAIIFNTLSGAKAALTTVAEPADQRRGPLLCRWRFPRFRVCRFWRLQSPANAPACAGLNGCGLLRRQKPATAETLGTPPNVIRWGLRLLVGGALALL